MYRVEREVDNEWEFYGEEKELGAAIFLTQEAFMQDHLIDEFYVYRVVDSNDVQVFRSY